MAEIDDPNFNSIIEEIEAEEKGSVEQVKEPETVVDNTTETPEQKKEGGEASNSSDEMYPHIGIMRDEGINKKDLPKEIRDMIISFDRKRRMSEMKGSRESTLIQLRKLSAVISDKIMDWTEKDLEEVEITNQNKKPTMEDGGEIEEVVTGEGTEPNTETGETDEVIETVNTEEVVGDGSGDGGEMGEGEQDDEGIFGGILGGIFNW